MPDENNNFADTNVNQPNNGNNTSVPQGQPHKQAAGQPQYPQYPGGSQPYSAQFAGGQQYDPNYSSVPGTPQGNGSFHVFESIAYGFKAVFKAPAVWLGGTAIYLIIAVVLSTPSVMHVRTLQEQLENSAETYAISGGLNTLSSFIVGILGICVSIFFYNAAFRQLRGDKLRFRSFTISDLNIRIFTSGAYIIQ